MAKTVVTIVATAYDPETRRGEGIVEQRVGVLAGAAAGIAAASSSVAAADASRTAATPVLGKIIGPHAAVIDAARLIACRERQARLSLFECFQRRFHFGAKGRDRFRRRIWLVVGKRGSGRSEQDECSHD